MDRITIIEAGSTEPFVSSPVGTDWRYLRHWWQWAIKTPAGRRALEEIGCVINHDRPWLYISDWYVTPWNDPGKPERYERVRLVREALGEPDSGVFYAGRYWVDAGPGMSALRYWADQTLIAISHDGSRAAICLLSG